MMGNYTHLLVGTPDEDLINAKMSMYAETHAVLHREPCFKNIQMAPEYPFMKVRLAPCVWVLERK